MKKVKQPKVDTSNVTKARFTNRKGEIKSVSSKVLKLTRLYSRTKMYQRVIVSFSVGLIMAIVSVLLAESTGLYVGGLSSFFQGTARFTRVALMEYWWLPGGKLDSVKSTIDLIYTLLFWGQYLLVNIGLFVFAWKKIGKEFSILTLVYIGTLQGFGFIFSQFVPQLGQLNLLGQTATVNQQLAQMNVKSLIFYPDWFPVNSAGQYVADWTVLIGRSEAMALNPVVVTSIDNANLVRIFSLVIYAALFGLVNALCASALFITGSSTAGSDIISVYFSQEKNIPIGKVMLIINIVGLLSGITLGSYATGLMVDPGKYCGIQYFISGNLLCSFIWAIIYSRATNAFFPWRKLTKVEVYTTPEKYEKIRNHLIDLGYTHPWTVIDSEGGYTKNKTRTIATICQVVEMPRLMSVIREIDKDGMIHALYVDGMDGKVAFLKQAR